jgi:DNA polymerase-3 subunit alpha
VVLIPFRDVLRSQYFHDDGDGITFYEKSDKYGAKFQENENSSQVFGKSSDVQIASRSFLPCEDWAPWKTGQRERGEVYIGHPLDDYKFEMKYFCNANLRHWSLELCGKNLTFGGIINDVQHRVAKTERLEYTLEGYDESMSLRSLERILSSVISLFKILPT